MVITVWATKSADRPLKGNWSFQPECAWTVAELKGEAWGKPHSVLILGNGNVAVFDPKLKSNVLLDAKGQMITRFAPQGEGPQEVRSQSFWFSVDGLLLIPDMGCVHCYDENGVWMESRKIAPMPPPRGFIDKDRMVMAPRTRFEVGGDKGIFSIIDIKDGTQSRDLFEVTDLFTGGSARVGGDVMDILVPGLSPMFEVGVGPHYLVYGSSQTYDLHVVTLTGKELNRFGIQRKNTPIHRTQIARHIKTMNLPNEAVLPLAQSFPEELVSFEEILIRGDQIWVAQASLDRLSDSQVYDIFSKEGVYLYRAELKLPEGEFLKSPFKNHDIRGNRLVAVIETPDGELYLASYQIQTPD